MPIPDGMEPAADARLSRRRALQLLAAAVVVGACDGPARRLEQARRGPTTSAAAPPGPTGTSADTTTSTTALSSTTAPQPPPSTTTSSWPEQPEQPSRARRDPGGALAGFAAFGDAGGGPGQVPVAQAMSRWAAGGHPIDALVTVGDNVYDFGEPHLFAAQLDEPYRELRAAGRPMWVTLGNHDAMRGHGPAQLAYLGLPPLPYTRELPGVRLFFLDGNRPDALQARWLDEQLTLAESSPQPPFCVVVFHQPVFSHGLHGPYAPLVANWRPVLENHRVPLVLSGHDHLYQRFRSDAGVTYVVTGGGGYALYQLRQGPPPPEMQASAVRHHFTSVEVFEDRLVVTAVASDDTVLDQTEIPARVPVPG